jgi:hypothetical protein
MNEFLEVALSMKKYLLLFSIIFINNNYSQISTINNSPIKSPEATAFVNANFMNLDEFTGKVNKDLDKNARASCC